MVETRERSFAAFEFFELAESSKEIDIASLTAKVKTNDMPAHSINVIAENCTVEVAFMDDDDKLLNEIELGRILTKVLDIYDAFDAKSCK